MSFNFETKVLFRRILCFKIIANTFLRFQVILLSCLDRVQKHLIDINSIHSHTYLTISWHFWSDPGLYYFQYSVSGHIDSSVRFYQKEVGQRKKRKIMKDAKHCEITLYELIFLKSHISACFHCKVEIIMETQKRLDLCSTSCE